MPSENPRIGEVDPTHVGPPDLILQEIVAPNEAPEDIRKRAADSVENVAEKCERWRGTTWADVTFAGRALALIEGTGEPDYDDYEDPLIWVFALSAESPVLGEAIVSVGVLCVALFRHEGVTEIRHQGRRTKKRKNSWVDGTAGVESGRSGESWLLVAR